jgi:RNA polymerase sigma-70 factor (ECF subfamily)
VDDLAAVEETELIERARHGDGAAFGELARRHATAALRVARVMTGGSSDAEDVVQEAMVKAYRALDRFRAESPLRPWLLRIVANEARNRRRSTGRRTRLAERVGTLSAPLVAAPSVEGRAVADDGARRMLAAVARLRDQDREVIALRYFAGLSEAEMAEALGVARGTVKSRLARALGRLRPLVAALDGGEGRDG